MNARRFFGAGYKIMERYDLFLLVLLAVFIVVSHVIWLHIDTRPQPSLDTSVDLKKTLEFIDNFPNGELSPTQAVIRLSRNGRPPFLQLLSVPFILVLGRSADAAITLNGLVFVVILAGTYAIGRVTLDRRAGIIAAFVVATMPPILNLSRIFLHYIASTAAVVVVVFLIQYMLKTRSLKSAWLFGISLGVAALIHPKALFYLALPAAVAGLYALFFQLSPRFPARPSESVNWISSKFRDRFVWLGLLPAGALGIAAAAAWYVPNLKRLSRLFETSSGAWHDVMHGFEGTSRTFWWFIQTSPNAISWPYVILLGVAIVVLALARRELMLTLLAIFLLMYYTHTSIPGAFSWMNGAAMLPVAAAMIGVATSKISQSPAISSRDHTVWKLLPATMVVAILLTGILNFVYTSMPVPPTVQSIAQRLGSPLGGSPCESRIFVAFCPNPPQGGNWAYTDIIDTIVADELCKTEECFLVVQERVHTQYQYYMVRDHPDANLRIVKIVRPRFKVHGYKRWNYLASDFVVFDPTLTDRMSLLLTSPDTPFSDAYDTVAEYVLPDGSVKRLIKRSHRLTETEEAYIALLDIAWVNERNPDVVDREYRVAKDKLTSIGANDFDSALDILHQFAAGNNDELSSILQDVIIGEQAYRDGDYELAIEALESAVVARPDDLGQRLTLANSYRAAGRLDEAIYHAQTAADLHPDRTFPLVLLGTLHRKNDDAPAAILAWQMALDLRPDMADICLQMGEALEQVDTQQAVEQYTACMKIDPEGKYGKKADNRRIELLTEIGD